MSSNELSETEIEKIKDSINERAKDIISGINVLQSISITDKISDEIMTDQLRELYGASDLAVIKLIAHKRQTLYKLGCKTCFRYLFSNIDKEYFDYNDVNYIKPLIYCPISYVYPDNVDEKTKKQLRNIEDDIEKLKEYLNVRFTNLYVCGLKDGEIRKIDYEDSEDIECLNEFVEDSFSDDKSVRNYSEQALNFYKHRNRCLLEHILSLKPVYSKVGDYRAELIVNMKPVVEMSLMVDQSML